METCFLFICDDSFCFDTPICIWLYFSSIYNSVFCVCTFFRVICVKMRSVAIHICNAKYTWLFWCECFSIFFSLIHTFCSLLFVFVCVSFILATTIFNAFDHFWRQFHDNICCSNNGPLCLLSLRVKPNLLLTFFFSLVYFFAAFHHYYFRCFVFPTGWSINILYI